MADWLNAIADLFALSDGRGGSVRSYSADRDDFPETLPVAESACALTYITGCEPTYSIGGPRPTIYTGRTEFHLAPNTSKMHLPRINAYYARIRNAMAGSMTLSGKVADFRKREGTAQLIRGPVELKYGDETGHLGLVVDWEVKVSEIDEPGYTPAA